MADSSTVMCCANCGFFQHRYKTPQMGDCGHHKRATMAMSYCGKFAWANGVRWIVGKGGKKK
jgi:hypothetical protein